MGSNGVVFTIVDVQNQQAFARPERVYKVEIELFAMFPYLSEVALIVSVRVCGLGIGAEVDIEIIEHVGKELEL